MVDPHHDAHPHIPGPALKAEQRARMGQVRVAAVALALVIGVANGGLMLMAPRPEPSEMRIFTVSAGLSPLSGLDVRG
ncbi:MAG: hypothetical protein B7Z20_07270 [Sphingobium sp. 32-64-5]|nr:MAG: hypothetical protein B7Z20_07270 [Sphingobium sp. 32-64-5]